MLTFEEILALLADPAAITAEQWAAINAALAELTAEQLGEMETALRDAFTQVDEQPRTQDSVALMGQLRDAILAAAGETQRRADEQAQLDEEAARIAAEIAGDGGDDGDAGDGETPSAETPPGEEAPADAPAETPPADGDQGAGGAAPEAVAASAPPARRAPLDGIRRRVPAERQPRRLEARTALVAGADLPGISAGLQFRDAAHLAEVMARKIDATRRVSSGEFLVASISHRYPEERRLGDDAKANGRVISAATSPEALTAAGGFCVPVAVNYDRISLSTAERPTRDAFAGFEATRGGVRWMTSPVIGDLDAAVRQWTEADDIAAAADPPTQTKPCVRVACGTERETLIHAVPLCLTFGNLGARTDPEGVQANNDVGLATHARFADTLLLTAYDALPDQRTVTSAQLLGAYRDLFYTFELMRSYFVNKYRTPRGQRFGFLAPDWVKAVIRADIMRSMAADGQGMPAWVSDEEIEARLRMIGYAPRWHYDGAASDKFANQPDAMPIIDYPAVARWRMWPEGQVAFLDGGRLDFGIVRDSETNKTNDYKVQFETFEGLANFGGEILTVESTVCPSGASAGTLAPACP